MKDISMPSSVISSFLILSNRCRSYKRDAVLPYFRAHAKKNIVKQLVEMTYLGYRYHFIPYHYIKYKCYLRSTGPDYIRYVPTIFLRRFRDHVNAQGRMDKVEDKSVFAGILAEAGFATPPILGELDLGSRAVLLDGQVMEIDDWLKRIRDGDYSAFFVKPAKGYQGRATLKLQRTQSGDLAFADGSLVSPASLMEKLSDPNRFHRFIAQPYLAQHGALSRLNPTSVNTVRIDTLNMGETVVANGALLRIGLGGSYTDNWHGGGLIVAVDHESGRLRGPGRRKYLHGGQVYWRHPTSDMHLEGCEIPYWSDIRELVLRAARLFPDLPSLAWDVAVEERGPVIVEANADWDVEMHQQGCGGLGDTDLGRAALAFARDHE